jgi:valyl-tRNA synthetase
MPAAYQPQEIEAAWSARWEAARLFVADANTKNPRRYSICLPPPNVTGELHMGHALNGTVQDIWARYRRMTGYEVLFLPGTDHAAIATQNVIERQLAAEGTSKEEMGREAFNARVERWYASVGSTIVSQYRELGASLDFTRLRFTMDPEYVRAVRTAFVHYYERGLLYRGPRIVNWCPNNLSAISDLEVDWQEHEDTLYFIRYPVEGGGEVTIATVRPETMLADTGVAVNPEDPRYRALVGKEAILPLVGRRLRVVADAAVEPGFGSGALKVTPGHDPLDYEIGERHGLPVVGVISPAGRMDTPDLPPYHGLTVAEAREAVVRDLRAEGFLVKQEPYTHQVGHCDRCGAVIEPLISEQWFLSMKELAPPAIACVEDGRVRFHPGRFARTYLDWMYGLRDWCVSRQLWLGHRIPVYTCANGHVFASVEEPQACTVCRSLELTQDPDVLDTWFSSALWPFATLGWPDATDDLRTFYPTNLDCTAREIINLWVARMIFSGFEFMGELPCRDVAITCVVQSRDGQRMSKSKGNVVDPRQLMRSHGADALRAWASSVAMSSQDTRFDESRIEGYRRFSNKLWNATRLVLSSAAEDASPRVPEPGALRVEDRWVLSRLQATVREVEAGIHGFTFQTSMDAIYDFAWGEFCDWYLEAIKPRLRAGDRGASAVAVQVLDVLFRLLHPFMPFVSEELWHRLPGSRDFLVRSTWPTADDGLVDAGAEAEFGAVMNAVTEIRALRKAGGLPDSGGRVALEDRSFDWAREMVASLARVAVVPELAGGTALTAVPARLELPAAASGAGRTVSELAKLQEEAKRVEAKLANPEFRTKAPPPVVEKEESRLARLKAAIERLR